MVPPADLISQILRALRLEGTVYFEARVSSPWAFAVGDTGFANFHHVTDGSCWVHTEGAPAIELRKGETIVFPHGRPHTLHDGRGSEPVDGTRLFESLDDRGVVTWGGTGTPTTLICGHFAYDRTIRHPLLASLPPVIRVDASPLPGWTTLARLAVTRSRELRPGSRALTDRLAEVLLIELLLELDQQEPGFLRAFSDPIVASALQALHDDPARDWTVESLARHVLASRSALASRFRELVGESPIRYLTHWRLQTASQLLRDTDLPAAEIARRVGYGTPFSFTKAFTRELGVAPSRFRRGARSASSA